MTMTEIAADGRRPGRPRALNAGETATVLSLYRTGLGYRAIARPIGQQGTLVSWSTVRRIVKANRKTEGTQAVK